MFLCFTKFFYKNEMLFEREEILLDLGDLWGFKIWFYVIVCYVLYFFFIFKKFNYGGFIVFGKVI